MASWQTAGFHINILKIRCRCIRNVPVVVLVLVEGPIGAILGQKAGEFVPQDQILAQSKKLKRKQVNFTSNTAWRNCPESKYILKDFALFVAPSERETMESRRETDYPKQRSTKLAIFDARKSERRGIPLERDTCRVYASVLC